MKNGIATPAPGVLPLEPQVTPAFGVGGSILIATGAILALIGIRNLWYRQNSACKESFELTYLTKGSSFLIGCLSYEPRSHGEPVA